MKTVMIHTADLHGELPVAIPPCDVLTISGDLCPNFSQNPNVELSAQASWLRNELAPYLRSQPIGWCIATWGNHDSVGYLAEEYISAECPVFWLVDRLKVYRGIRFYATPWTRTFGQHCNFMADEDRIALRFDAIPPCDVLLSHGPPYQYGDFVIGPYGGEECGSPSLLRNIKRVRPTLTVFGHIHPANGLYWHDGLPLANVAAVNKAYEPIQPMLRTTWEDNRLLDMEPVR